ARLLDEATIKETFFYREPKLLEDLDWWALLENARRQGSDTVAVWSAGCATGEEAYTLAMLALEAFHPLPPPVRILATDVSGAADRLCVPLHGAGGTSLPASPRLVAPPRALRKPLAEPLPTREQRLALAEAAVAEGDHDRAVEQTASLSRHDPMDAEPHYVQG